MVLRYGTIDDEVKRLQTQLNSISPTRLPRLSLDTLFDPITMARVMEFQSQKGLATDGVVGSHTQRSLTKQRAHTGGPLGRVVVADLINDRLRAFENGILRFDFRQIKGGSPSDPSTRGVFKVYKRLRHHTSSTYPEPPGNMDYALFFHGTEALHQGPPTVFSHGCIHVRPSEAAQLFNWAGQVELMVIVLKLNR